MVSPNSSSAHCYGLAQCLKILVARRMYQVTLERTHGGSQMGCLVEQTRHGGGCAGPHIRSLDHLALDGWYYSARKMALLVEVTAMMKIVNVQNRAWDCPRETVVQLSLDSNSRHHW